MPVSCTITFPDPRDHRIHVRLDLPAGGDLVFPSWAPGSYLMREFARNVRGLHAHRAGGPVALRRTARNLWTVAGPCTVEYDVYAREKSVRTPFLDETLAFFLPSNVIAHPVLPPPDGFDLRVQIPPGHRGLCPLGPIVEGPAVATWHAADVDALHDSPVAVGPFAVTRFTVDGVPHEHGIEPGHNGDEARMTAALRRIVAAARETVGGPLPYPRYQFVTLHARDGHGGLEHKDGSVLLRPRLGFASEKGWEEWVTLAAHEHFHAWNVKRLFPDTLGPRFDYAREHHTRNLWWLEGGTVYYEERIAYRAGLVTPKRHLERLAELAQKVASTPGRRHQSLEDSSFDAWIKLYRPGEDSPNSTLSYYLKGAVVLWAMDLEILARSGGRHGLDDVLRRLWNTWAVRGVGFPEEGAVESVAAELAGGGDFGRWFDLHVRGTHDILLDAALAPFGWTLAPGERKPGSWLGVELRGASVTSVREDGPCWPAVAPGDELVALGGERLGADDLGDRLRDLAPGTPVSLTLARDGRLVTRDVRTAAAPVATLSIVDRPDSSPAAAELREKWLARMDPLREIPS